MLRIFLFIILTTFISACQTTKTDKIEDPYGAFAVGHNFTPLRNIDFAKEMERNIPNPDKAILFIYNHGTSNGGHGQKCYPESIPSYARAIVRQHDNTVIFYLCSQQVSGKAPGESRYFKRSVELELLLERFKRHGVTPDRTFLLGHSGGASTTLIAAADIPDSFNGFIVSAPGYGFAYTGESKESDDLAPYYQIWKATIEQATEKPGLVYAFEGDTIAPPEDLDFMENMKNITLLVQTPEDCGISDFHGYPWSRCFREKETPKIWQYIQHRISIEQKQASNSTN
ncbi:hypothetical protein [uncultured Kiloniella sp.]|uniref:hypothetical protein n=1 Tax=uncultured Kiloniella sp. TaxID=1133091 RepID=UPI002613737B|nr:hypothetical protein [uncultured Kiloniella sp.]